MIKDYNTPFDWDNFTTVKLDKIRFGMEQAFSERFLGAHAEVDVDRILYEIRFRVRGYLLGETLETIVKHYPKDWWQAFKERWFPRWAKIRWPVEYTELSASIKAIYPKLKVSLPDEEHQIIIHLYDRTKYRST